MKKIIIPFMLAFTSTMVNAEYIIQIPFEQAQGGPLPNNSIVFVSSTEVVPETPVKHEPVDCLTNPTDNPQLCEKSLTAWEQFATDRDLPQTWSDLSWGNKGLSYLPNEPYPITSVSELILHSNQLTNVDGLSNLTSVGTLHLAGNQITNVDGLSNLTSVGTLYLHNNQLTNVDALSNLTSVNVLYLTGNQITNVDVLSNLKSVGGLHLNSNKLENVDALSNLEIVDTLHLHNNQLTNVNGLANLKVTRSIAVDGTYSGPKLAANTRFCNDNPDSVFPVGYAQYAKKSQLCK